MPVWDLEVRGIAGHLLQRSDDACSAPGTTALNGGRRKDKHTSDGMDQLCSLLHLPWPLRVGLGLIKTMEASTRPRPLDQIHCDRLCFC